MRSSRLAGMSVFKVMVLTIRSSPRLLPYQTLSKPLGVGNHPALNAGVVNRQSEGSSGSADLRFRSVAVDRGEKSRRPCESDLRYAARGTGVPPVKEQRRHCRARSWPGRPCHVTLKYLEPLLVDLRIALDDDVLLGERLEFGHQAAFT